MIRHRITATVAMTAAAALLLSGCGRADDTGDTTAPVELGDGPATGELTIWAQGTEGEALKDFLAPFEEANPDVDIEVTPVPWDSAQNKYQTAVAGNTTPDIGMLGSDWMASFGSALLPTPAELDTSDIFPVALETTDLDGTQFGVPWYVETRVLFYRTDLMEQAGFDEFPTDWEGFKNLAKAFQDNGADYGVTLPAAGWNSFIGNLPFAWSNGGDIIDADRTQWQIDSPENAEALEYIRSFFDEGIADPNPDNESGSQVSRFIDGTTPMFISGPWDIPGVLAAGGPEFADKYAVAQIPASPDGVSTSFSAGGNLVVFENSKNPDAAWKLIQWLIEPEVQVEWYKTVNGLPSQQSAWEDPALADDAMTAVFGQQLQSTKTPPALTTWPEISSAADTQIEQIMLGVITAEEGLAVIQAEADKLGFGD
ncbi:sugar ABC transporter substrate-binding protein [Microbacterium sp. NPDC055903]